MLQKYMDASDGLTIFTLGAREIRFGRKGGKIRSFEPYQVDVVSTLGAGDTFKAGCVYALWAGMDALPPPAPPSPARASRCRSTRRSWLRC